MQRTGKKEPTIEDIVVREEVEILLEITLYNRIQEMSVAIREEVETHLEVTLYNKIQEIPIPLWEIEVEGKRQADTVDLMETMEEHHRGKDSQEGTMEDQTSIRTAK